MLMTPKTRRAPLHLAAGMALLALLVLALIAPGEAQAQSGPQVSTTFSLAPGILGPDGLKMEEFVPADTPGQPALPWRDIALALHPHMDPSTLRVEVSGGPTDTVPGRHELAPNPPFTVAAGTRIFTSWGQAGVVLAGRDMAAYGDGIFPASVVTRRRVTDRRGLKVLHLRYTPLRYRHTTGTLLLDRHTEVTVRYRLLPDKAPVRPDRQLLPHLRRVENPDQAAVWYRAADSAGDSQKLGFAIIIPDALSKLSQQLKTFATFKETMGYKVTMVTDSVLAAMPATSQGGDAERIRLWLQKNYKTLNLKYVLLVGNPDPRRAGVPMKNTYAMATHIKYPNITPSDYYYADLSGNWDLDGDGKVAEYSDDMGQGGIDWTPEVYVGRIPIYDNNAQALDRILKKTMAYQSPYGDRTWRKRVLQPAAMLFYDNQYGGNSIRIDGADMANTIWTQSIKPYGLSRTTLFEEDGVDPSKHKGDVPLTKDNLIKVWASGFGLVTWFGHGSANGVYRTIWKTDDGNKIPDYKEISSPSFLTFADVLRLDDSKPAIVFHGSCSNGYPERPDNIGYGLLLNGAVATASSSRVAIVVLGGTIGTSDANIFGVERDFTKALVENKSVGQGLLEAKQKISDSLGMLTWFTRLQINLYGDPSVALTSCAKSADCDDGKACNGEEVCHSGQCHDGVAVTCGSSDPCTLATCDEKTGACKTAPRADGLSCDDGMFCTVNETCQSGKCLGAARCAVKDNPCVTTTCSEAGRTCQLSTKAQAGQVCRAGTDRQGVCTSGLCWPDDADAKGCAISVGGGQTPPPLTWPLLAAALLIVIRRRRENT